MISSALKRNKIVLTDYPYQKDIAFRATMAELSVFEVSVLTEIVQGSLKTSVSSLADYLEVGLERLLQTLEKLKKTQLYRLEHDTIHVDKEKRKYYESQIPKFDNDFRADMEFLKGLLSKVPIHILPVWYSISKTSDDIFLSIVEKYLQTPKIYKRYLDDLTFEEPILNEIVKEVYAAPDYKIKGKDLMQKYALSREKFEEFMLQLEFNLVCCLSYNQSGEQWEEVITPFYEWRQYLRHVRDNAPAPIEDTSQIKRDHPQDFGFVQEMTLLLRTATQKPLLVEQQDGEWTLSAKESDNKPSYDSVESTKSTYLSRIIDHMLHLKLIEVKGSSILPKSTAKSWLDKHVQEQAITLYRVYNAQRQADAGGINDRNLREIEKNLKEAGNLGWIYFHDFTKACLASIGANNPVSLIQKGKRWKYELPEYSEDDIETIRRYIFGPLFQSGIVSTGRHLGKECFCVTPFGRMTLE